MKGETMGKEETVELFEIRIRGALAAAFDHAEIVPDEKQWKMLRGEAEITMKDLGEISFTTVMNFSLRMVDRKPLLTQTTQEAQS